MRLSALSAGGLQRHKHLCCPRAWGWLFRHTLRAAETENPTKPALRRALASTAQPEATNTSPFPSSSRLVASHLQEVGCSDGSAGLVAPAFQVQGNLWCQDRSQLGSCLYSPGPALSSAGGVSRSHHSQPAEITQAQMGPQPQALYDFRPSTLECHFFRKPSRPAPSPPGEPFWFAFCFDF